MACLLNGDVWNRTASFWRTHAFRTERDSFQLEHDLERCTAKGNQRFQRLHKGVGVRGNFLMTSGFNQARGNLLDKSSIQALVVEDYEPFRRFLISTLQNRCDLRDIHEVSDGLEAVQEAETLQPDLILLDIGLPKLNGIEAARRILKVSPASKIIFVTQESSPDVVQEALGLGALGYIIKAHAGRELIAGVEAVREGRLFVSSGVTSQTLAKPAGK